jgi:hypothetical protein
MEEGSRLEARRYHDGRRRRRGDAGGGRVGGWWRGSAFFSGCVGGRVGGLAGEGGGDVPFLVVYRDPSTGDGRDEGMDGEGDGEGDIEVDGGVDGDGDGGAKKGSTSVRGGGGKGRRRRIGGEDDDADRSSRGGVVVVVLPPPPPPPSSSSQSSSYPPPPHTVLRTENDASLGAVILGDDAVANNRMAASEFSPPSSDFSSYPRAVFYGTLRFHPRGPRALTSFPPPLCPSLRSKFGPGRRLLLRHCPQCQTLGAGAHAPQQDK